MGGDAVSEIPEFQDSGGMDPYGVGVIGDVVSQGIGDVTGVISQYFGNQAADPCERVLHFEAFLDGWIDTRNDLEGWAAEAVAWIDQARDRALASWWIDPRQTGAPSFPAMIRTRTLYRPSWPMPPLAWFDVVLPQLPPDGFTRPPTGAELAAQTGLPLAAIPQIASGIYLAPNGKIGGPRLIEVYDAWVEQVEELTVPTEWPRAHTDLAQVVGSADWRPGDPAGGYLGQVIEVVERLRAMHPELLELCDIERGRQYELARQPGELYQERNRLIAAAAVLVVALWKRGKR